MVLALALAGTALAPVAADAVPAYVESPADYVDPFVGTTNAGNTFPGALVPFGMTSFSPDQGYYGGPTTGTYANQGYLRSSNPGGYTYTRTSVRGFSLTHISGPGCAGGSGDVPIFPLPGAITQAPTVAEGTAPVQATYSHDNEEASAGYYRVGLNSGVNVELTATERTGQARFQFPVGSDGTVLVRAAESMVGSTDADVQIDPASRTVTGSVTSGAFCGGFVGDGELRRSYYTVHYVIEFDRPFKSVGTWTDTALAPNSYSAHGGNTVSYAEGVSSTSGATQSGYGTAGKGAGGYLVFDTSANQTVGVRIGISYVSTANAKLNLDAETPSGRTFEQTRQAAVDKWNAALRAIQVAGGTEDERTAFYSAMYHALIHPSLGDDVNGEYMGFDGDRRVFRVGEGQEHQYHTFSGWDVYRGLTQLQAWLDPQIGSDIAYSLLNQAQQNRFNAQGERPQPGDADQGKDEWDRWTHVQGGTHVMVGDPSAQTLAGILAYGGDRFPAETAYQSLADGARNPTARDYS
ncbi:MAG: glycoside hydrolase family 92 protein, partial [Bifidobacteriaceae bacterium]|nr:glycoside hydrolase family 92 protein [Bifidobacteriaceae bacterium]